MQKIVHITGFAALALGWLVISPAQGQDADVALARHLFEEGIAFVDQEDWAQAADRFERSLALRPSPIVAYNLGSTFVELGRLVEASEAFRRATLAAAAPLEVSQAARESLAEVEARIGTLTVELTGDTDGVDVFVDDRLLPAQAIGVSAPVDPGVRVVRALRDGAEVATARAEIPEGGFDQVSLEIAEREPSPAPTLSGEAITGSPGDPAASDGGLVASPWFWVGAGAVVVGVVAVILALVLGGSEESEAVPGNLTPAVVEF